MENNKIYDMKFSKIYQLLINKALKKGRTKEETSYQRRCLRSQGGGGRGPAYARDPVSGQAH